tara:strand:- start:4295 stop:5377 length:1083 start_codon:yes stop_codon:yes gene_type:complete
MADVANYTIENNSGANVRIDLNSVFAAIQSLNSKNTDLATSQCVAGMPFLNTTTNILKIRNSTNGGFTEIGNIDTANLGLLPAGGGTMTGALLGHDGSTAAAPAFSFDTDTDLGLFRKQANIMGFSSAGTEQMIFDANGITLRSQNEIRFGDSDSSHYIAIKPPATVTANKTITLPSETGTLLTTASTINTSQLSGASVTIGSTSVALGGTATTLTGISELTVTTLNATNQNVSNIKNSSGGNQSTADQIYQGRAKAWVNFNGTNTTIRDDFGVTSIGDHGQGIYQVNFDSSFSNTNYAPVGFVHRNGSTGNKVLAHIDTLSQQNAASYRFMVSGTNNAANVGLVAIDVQYVFLSFFGDQ